MNFIEASNMEEGTKFTLKEYSHKGYLYFHYGNIFDEKNNQQYANVNLFNAIWEVVDDNKDWNLASNYHTQYNINGDLAKGRIPLENQFNWSTVKKCRDLILEDIKKERTFGRNTYQSKRFEETSRSEIEQVAYHRCEYHINKRFGDL